MRSSKPLLLLVIVAVALFFGRHARTPDAASPVAAPTASATASATTSTTSGSGAALPAFLPPEAHDTLALIASDGPFPHRQDGVVFGNYEHLLPEQPRGYYHEYTVDTPGARTRGTRRIITGGTPPAAYYYTDDHYRSFRQFAVPR